MHDEPELASLSLAELEALRDRWYRSAGRDGSFAAIRRVVRELGTCRPKRHGSVWTWQDEDAALFIHEDDYNGYLTVRDGGRQVAFSGGGSGMFVPGPWMARIRAADVAARAAISARAAQVEEHKRLQLVALLGGSDAP